MIANSVTLMMLLTAQVFASEFDGTETRQLLAEFHRTTNDVDFAARLERLEQISRAHPRAFVKDLIQFAAHEPELVGMGWWILKLAAGTGSDEETVKVAIELLESNDASDVAKDVLRAVSVKRTSGSGPLRVTYAGLGELLEARDLTPALTQFLLAEDVYGTGNGLWELTLRKEGTADKDQPEKRVLSAMHLAESLEYRIRYGFPVEDTPYCRFLKNKRSLTFWPMAIGPSAHVIHRRVVNVQRAWPLINAPRRRATPSSSLKEQSQNMTRAVRM